MNSCHKQFKWIILKRIKQNVFRNDRINTVLVFSFFFAWLLSFAFEGRIFYALSDNFGNFPMGLIAFGPMIAHLIGIIISGFFINTIRMARHMIIYSITFCTITSCLIFFPQPSIWIIAIIFSSFLSGICVASWSFFLKKSTPKGKRIKTVADGLIGTNVLMIVINLSVINKSLYVGISVSIFLLIIALVFSLFLNVNDDFEENNITDRLNVNSRSKTNKMQFYLNVKSKISSKPIFILVVFILIITINSGLMYRVMIPSFSHLESFTAWFWAIPYIVAILAFRNLSDKFEKSYIIYTAILMMGIAFIAFYFLGKSIFDYFIVNTLMLGAFGIIDIFWWSTLGEMLDFYKNPAKIFGIGLSANVLGIIIGGIIGEYIYSASELSDFRTMITALIVICITIIVISRSNEKLLFENL